MEGIKIVYQCQSPKKLTYRRSLNTSSPTSIRDQSSKLFRIQVNTPTFYRSNKAPSSNISPKRSKKLQIGKKKQRVSYIPNSSVYQKLNVRLTLNNLEFSQNFQIEPRVVTKSQLRKTIDFTTQNRYFNRYLPILEARGSSINYMPITN